ncbi:MAG: AAA family ATPase, partial [Gammaproteobacteria bacterium]
LEHNRIVAEGRENEIEELLRIVEPRLKKLRSLQVDSRGFQRQQPVLYADIGLKHLIPVTQLGQGFNRLLTIFLAVLRSDAKILLVDEIENGLHYTAQKAVWKGLAEAARRADIQVFATTHSWGCIVAAHEAFAESEQYDFALHRIQQVKGNFESVTYDREMLESSLETELEVR